MEHNDIFDKFMIEYDKAQMDGSSYPSLTAYERATILDKAYLTLIDQKFTGYNWRQMPFEADIKAIEDLRPLISHKKYLPLTTRIGDEVSNEYVYNVWDSGNNDVLYYIQSRIETIADLNSIDGKDHYSSPVVLISHEDANKFKASDHNLPWMKEPVAYIENSYVRVLVDGFKMKDVTRKLQLYLTYIKKPKKFVDDYDTGTTKFELNDVMAEELINLAITMAGEIVESPRQSVRAQYQAYNYDNRANKTAGN